MTSSSLIAFARLANIPVMIGLAKIDRRYRLIVLDPITRLWFTFFVPRYTFQSARM